MGQQFSLKKVNGTVENLFKVIIFDLDGTLVDLKVDWKSLKNKLENTFQKEFQPLHEGIRKLGNLEKEKAFEIIRNYELENLEKWEINLFFININEYKRFQTPPTLRVSSKAFGMGRRMPIVAKYLDKIS